MGLNPNKWGLLQAILEYSPTQERISSLAIGTRIGSLSQGQSGEPAIIWTGGLPKSTMSRVVNGSGLDPYPTQI